jgi:NADPH:quinone reductase-like Zn-dependent oxidoreductase
MKAMVIRAPGGLENLALVERARPEPGAGEVLIRVGGSSLNYHDYVIAKGVLRVPDGLVMMTDGAGEVVALGEGVRSLAVGDRVVAVYYPAWRSGEADAAAPRIRPGEGVDGYGAQYVAVPETWVTRAPAGYSDLEAATLTCAGITAWRGVVTEGKVRPGDTVLVQGTGGVSIFALQFAKAAGAMVIATSSSDEKLERLKALGADHVVNYRQTPAWGETARKLTGGRGVDIVVEIGGAGTLAQSIQACRVSGHISLIGVLAGISGEVPVAAAFGRQLTIKGLAVGSREDQLAMIRGIEASGLKPVVDSVFPLEALADAYRRQEAQRHFGKICIEI